MWDYVGSCARGAAIGLGVGFITGADETFVGALIAAGIGCGEKIIVDEWFGEDTAAGITAELGFSAVDVASILGYLAA